MASDLDRARQLYNLDRGGFANLMNLQVKARGFALAELLRRDGSLIIAADTANRDKLPRPVEAVFEAADTGDPVGIPPGGTNFIGAMFKLRDIPDAYLYTIVLVRPEVVAQLRLMESNTKEYAGLEANRLPVQLAFAVLYVGVSLTVLLAAIWTGISVADRFVSPIRRLITAADEVRAGNLDVAVGSKHTEGDLRNLSETFNVMIRELKRQRDDLVQARDDIGHRARFTEAVLSGVSAAVIGVDGDGRITIANTAARPLLAGSAATGAPLAEAAPELAGVLSRMRAGGGGEWREQVTVTRNGAERTLNVACTAEEDAGDGDASHVFTIDDITDLVAAQRNTAWSDVARRIAHEIKNPLTPIQLSAERIRRRYGKFITEDREVFDQCTDTIIRQVGDIGRMVDEFSAFARMPKPQMELRDLRESLNEAVFLQKVALPDIEFVTDFGPQRLAARYDGRLLSQAFINIMKNASEAIQAAGAGAVKPRISVVASRVGQNVVVDFTDNGIGWPKENRQRLLEPYMTTREKGTGLGLAIVRKIVEDHGGTIELLDAPQVATGGRGATVRIGLPAETAEVTGLRSEA
jgi:two-component system nitrogen regulation sensor histidine kinase NtrY